MCMNNFKKESLFRQSHDFFHRYLIIAPLNSPKRWKHPRTCKLSQSKIDDSVYKQDQADL